MESMEVLRIDDIPLLYKQIEELHIQKIIDESIQPHGNRQNLSIGHLVSIWLCYLLSEGDHRLSPVESWVSSNELLLRSLSGQQDLNAKDFTDDRLEQALDYLSQPDHWQRIDRGISSSSLEIYSLASVATIRLDAAPMQGHHSIDKQEGLFQHGYSKHHDARLGMLKIMLACLDNPVSSFSYPLTHMVVSGNQSDDGLYLPIIAQCTQVLSHAGVSQPKLYVGDSKMSSKENRFCIQQQGDYYLMPLSKKQYSQQARQEAIEQFPVSQYIKVYQHGQQATDTNMVAQGFEQQRQVSYVDESGQEHTWQERCLFVLSTAYHKAQCQTLETRLEKATLLLTSLLESKQGKKIPKTPEELDQKINQILKDNAVEGLLQVEITTKEHLKHIRAYKDREARIEKHYTFSLDIRANQAKIQAHKDMLGWQVYATQMEASSLDFHACVWKYRHQNRVESRFHDLRNKVVPLVPIFVKKDNRVEALVNLLMLCVKIGAVMEYKAAKHLKEQAQQLSGIFEGNPKKATATPTATRLLKQFVVSMVVMVNPNTGLPEVKVTKMNKTQQKIIELLDFNQDIYLKIDTKIKMFFSKYKISEN